MAFRHQLALLCRASLEALRVMGARPDILHLHEWQCSAVAMLYWDVYYNTGFNTARVVLTIHNMDNSGECRQDEFAVTGVPGAPPDSGLRVEVCEA
jgi:starch synthase